MAALVVRTGLKISRNFSKNCVLCASTHYKRVIQKQARVIMRASSSSSASTNLHDLPNKHWEEKLSPEQYYVCREKGTEEPFSGKFYLHHEEGMYTCVCCGTELFSASAKYDSGCGWPAFTAAHGSKNGDEAASNVIRRPDSSMGLHRTEVICRNCNSHLGHVFDDGPPPTKNRFCINSIALDFVPAKK